MHTFPLQFWKPQHIPFDESDSLALQYLLLRIGRRVAVLQVHAFPSFRVRCPVVLVLAPAVDTQIACHSKNPRTNVVHQHPVPQRAVQAKKSLLSNLFRQRVPASQRTQIPKHWVAQFEEPSLDFSPEVGRVGI